MTSTSTTAARLYHELWLESRHILDGIQYEMATSKCSDCPNRDWANYEPQSYSEMEFGIRIAETCCYDDPDTFKDSMEHVDKITQLMDMLKAFAGDEEIAAAQKEVSKHGT